MRPWSPRLFQLGSWYQTFFLRFVIPNLCGWLYHTYGSSVCMHVCSGRGVYSMHLLLVVYWLWKSHNSMSVPTFRERQFWGNHDVLLYNCTLSKRRKTHCNDIVVRILPRHIVKTARQRIARQSGICGTPFCGTPFIRCTANKLAVRWSWCTAKNAVGNPDGERLAVWEQRFARWPHHQI